MSSARSTNHICAVQVREAHPAFEPSSIMQIIPWLPICRRGESLHFLARTSPMLLDLQTHLSIPEPCNVVENVVASLSSLQSTRDCVGTVFNTNVQSPTASPKQRGQDLPRGYCFSLCLSKLTVPVPYFQSLFLARAVR